MCCYIFPLNLHFPELWRLRQEDSCKFVVQPVLHSFRMMGLQSKILSQTNLIVETDVVVNIYKPQIWEVELEDHEFKVWDT